MKPQKIEKKAKKKIGIALLLALIIALITFYFTKEITYTLIAGIAVTVLLIIYLFMKEKLKESDRIQKMEEVFPDFIELVSSNLRAGMTIDKAILFSSRREFYPLDQEIVALGKEIITGKEITRSLSSLAERIKSEKITKTINIIITGIKAGGNVAVLLEETAKNMRERQFVEKKAASNVLMYVIFIAFAVGVGAPALFALSTVLVSVLSKILSSLPAVDTTAQFAFTLTKVNISVNFVT
ncbi:MAG TPA: type II secretion system F family protein, partial [Candidatus Nanoarchaeia archaeon]|nr:type II secretion system F family protein [Candidatus Nanoarchaeia archaeon]